MTYVPFARKYRPRLFKEVVGQEVPVKVLRGAVKGNRLSHAYLFAGPRGVGKTTLARILAKAVNCPNAKEGEPCGECEVCKEIDRGSFPDLIEMDAASNRGIDDVRALREAVQYRPIKGKKKVYIIDEAHMLTKEAFNALLKTLEEPPPDTLFILCTTEYDKIPPTILSRCQRLLFSRLKEEEVVNYLKEICKKEGLECEEEALRILAQASEGCLRDAASLLDQSATYGEGKVRAKEVRELLGIPEEGKVLAFLKDLLGGKTEEPLRLLKELHEKGYSLSRFWERAEELLRRAILSKASAEEAPPEISSYPTEKLLYLESVLNRAKAEARTRDPLSAYQLAVVKSGLIKEIVPLSKLLQGGLAVREAESPSSPAERVINSVKNKVLKKALVEAQREERDGKVVFKLDEKLIKSYAKELEALKASFPEVEFEKVEVKKKRGDTQLF